MNYIDAYESDYGKVITLPFGSTLRIILEENPSTGFRWQVEDKSSSCLNLLTHEFYANKEYAIGATGTEVFYFEPARPGRCLLFLKLLRSWEGDKSIIKRFRITVII
ncbi:MAG: hypothetical protein H6Q67_1994 [Firmicutes bacterium]|nr:hypothetical protein [Bacillota bacterium]